MPNRVAPFRRLESIRSNGTEEAVNELWIADHEAADQWGKA